jgi:hypothetical protein
MARNAILAIGFSHWQSLEASQIEELVDSGDRPDTAVHQSIDSLARRCQCG